MSMLSTLCLTKLLKKPFQIQLNGYRKFYGLKTDLCPGFHGQNLPDACYHLLQVLNLRSDQFFDHRLKFFVADPHLRPGYGWKTGCQSAVSRRGYLIADCPCFDFG